MIVADTNLVLYLVTGGQFVPEAEAARSRDRVWVVPYLVKYELGNALATYVKHDQLTRDEAVRRFRHGLAFVQISDIESDPVAIFNLCRTGGLSAYDAEFVWLAQTLGVQLVTGDQDVIREFPNVAIGLPQFAAGRR